MLDFFKNLFFSDYRVKNTKGKEIKNNLKNPKKLSRPFFGNVEILDYNFDKEILEQDKTFQEIAVFQKVNQTILSNLTSKEISKEIVDQIRKTLGYTAGVLFIIDWKTGKEWPYVVSSDLSDKLKTLFGKQLSKHVGEIIKQDNLVVKSAVTEKIYIASDARDVASPVLSYRKAFLMQKFFNMKKLILIPLKVKGRTTGALVVATPRNEVKTREKLMLKMLTDQIAIALYNAKLYEEIQNQVQALEEKTQDLRSLLEVSEIAASSLETKAITQKIVDSIPDKLGHLGYLGGFLSMYDPKRTSVCAYCITESDLVQKNVRTFLHRPFNEYCAYANKDKNLTIDAILTGKTQMGEELEKFVCPPLDARVVRKIQRLMGIRANVLLPIFIRGQIIGSFMFFAKKPLKEVSERDINLMKAFVGHAGVSIDNALLFDRALKQLKDLTQAKAKLEQTLAMKGEFVHIVSHQLRTPLTVVRGLISMWYDGDFEKMPMEKQKDFRERIKTSAEKLNNITNQMLKAMEFEGSVKLNLEQVDLMKVIKSVMDLLKPNFEKKKLYLKFENKIRKKEFFIEADANYIPHVFNNLIDNAEKYTFKGGVAITIGSQGNHVCVKIQDTGVGITKENQERLFKKFSRGVNALKDNPSGSGLGLFIAKQIVNEHRGKIIFDSAGKNKGTVFTVTLPVKQAKE